jgi:hypothetical protein
MFILPEEDAAIFGAARRDAGPPSASSAPLDPIPGTAYCKELPTLLQKS